MIRLDMSGLCVHLPHPKRTNPVMYVAGLVGPWTSCQYLIHATVLISIYPMLIIVSSSLIPMKNVLIIIHHRSLLEM